MTKIAIWCRHKEDGIIGIGPQIPWHIASDFKRFRRITQGQSLIAGQTTYESFPNRTLPNRKIYVLTFESDYQVSDKENHFVITDYHDCNQIKEDVYIAGGASVYKLFMEKSAPEIVVESVYLGDLDDGLTGQPVDIKVCADKVAVDYEPVSKTYLLDNVATTVWLKKGIVRPIETINHIINAIEQGEEK